MDQLTRMRALQATGDAFNNLLEASAVYELDIPGWAPAKKISK
jgi:hypothetical protein